MIEFALITPIFLTLAFGLTEFSNLMQHRSIVASGARDGARYASFHALSLSNATPPPSNTIQGEVLSEGSAVSVANNDTDIQIKYFTPNPPSFTTTAQCGHYAVSAGANTIVLEAGYAGTQAQCTAIGQLISVTVKHTYQFSSPLQVAFPSGVAVSATAWATIQQ